MTRGLAVVMLALACSLPASAAAERYPVTTVVENVPAEVDADSALVGVQIYLAGGLDRQSSVQNGFAALLAEVVGHTPVGPQKTPLRTAIAGLGASLGISVEPQEVRYYVEGRPDAVKTALALLGAALAEPDFSHATLAAAKSDMRLRESDADQSPFGVVSAMLRGAYYRGSGVGFAPLGATEVVANAGADALHDFWAQNYRAGGAVVSAAGHVDDAVARAVTTTVAGLPAGQPPAAVVHTQKPTDPPARIVTHRDVGLPWVGMGFAAPPVGSKDFATMLVVQAVITSLGRTDSIVSRPAALRPINAIYQYDVSPANFIIYSSGNSLSSPTGLRKIFAATDLLASKPLDAAVVERYRKLAMGQFVLDNMTLEDRSALVGLSARLGLGADYPNAVLDAIAAVSPADVQRVVKTYLHKYTIALVLPRANLQTH
jgi:zinc protease